MPAKEGSRKKKKRTLVLLDAHAILHRAYHALPDFTGPDGAPTGALYGVVSMLLRTIEELNPDYIVACFDLPEPTYRHEVYEGYKATRAETDESLTKQIERSRDLFAAFGITIYEHPGFEADDMLGTIVEQIKMETDMETIIASGDMDTLQLVDKKRVRVYTQRKGSEVAMYDEAAIKERFGFTPELTIDYKGLRGDPSDNIPGVPGVGDTSAKKLVQTFGSVENILNAIEKEGTEVVAKKAGIQKRFVELVFAHEEEAKFSKMLATIRRDAPITFMRPEKTWREKLDIEAILQLFAELGFRTLAARVQAMFGAKEESPEDKAESIDSAVLQETAVALWLLESDTTNPTLEDIIAYGRTHDADAGFTEAQKCIFAELKKQKLERFFDEVEKPLIDILKQMRERGVRIDTAYLKKLSKKMHRELAQIETRIHTHAKTEFNINSPKQLADVLYDTLGLKAKNAKKTATGQRSTRESELEKLIDEHPIISEILRYRELQKLLSTYIDTIPDMVARDGRLHPTLLQAGTTTGRMASKDPNIQNIPVRTDEGRAIRRAFIPEDKHVLVAVDYSQIELRIAAILSGDKKLIDIFTRGEDVHRGVAVRVFGVDADKVTDNMRRQAKVINFGILYGMGVNALRQNLGAGTTRAEAQEFLNAYFNTFTELAEYLEATKVFAREHGYTTTLFGRRRHFPGITSSVPFIRAQAERMAINAPIQGTEGDILRIAMKEIYDYIQKEKLDRKVHMLFQVHDELMFEIHTDALSAAVPELVSIMEDVFKGRETHGVPIEVDVKIGNNWEEMKKWHQGDAF